MTQLVWWASTVAEYAFGESVIPKNSAEDICIGSPSSLMRMSTLSA